MIKQMMMRMRIHSSIGARRSPCGATMKVPIKIHLNKKKNRLHSKITLLNDFGSPKVCTLIPMRGVVNVQSIAFRKND